MPEPLVPALAGIRASLLDDGSLVRAVAAGRRRGQTPAYRRAELRPVDVREGRRLQLVTQDERQATTRNLGAAEAAAAIDELLAQPFGNWHVETTDATVQLRVTKKGEAQVHRTRAERAPADGAHDRAPRRLLDPDDPMFSVLGADSDKRRQVDAFLRVAAPALTRAREISGAQDSTDARPLRVTDLGCGNAYLTFAAHRWLTGTGPVTTVGVDSRPGAADHARQVAERLDALSGTPDHTGAAPTVIEGTIAAAQPFGEHVPDVVVALHACDTATDDALARAIGWRAPVVLAAPCCHHDVRTQLAATTAPEPYGALLRDGILTERFADVLTDTLRAELLRLHGYRVDVVEFVASRHTPRNSLIRAVRTDAAPDPERLARYNALTAAWGLTPALQRSIGLP